MPCGLVKAEVVPVPATRHPWPVPEAPTDLAEAGLAVWADAWALPWTAAADRGAILNLCRLEDERALLKAALDEHGAMLSKPVVTPKGDVVGQESYANPVLRELRRVDVAVLALRDRLGLTPLYRARLGLALVELEVKQDAAVESLRAKYRRYGSASK
jgi:hypothetical protein